MRLETISEEAGAVIICNECKQRVSYYAYSSSGSTGWHWACAKPGELPPPLDAGQLQALNTCRPCPWISCRHHLYLEVHPTTGAMKINFKGNEPDELEETCAIDIGERGGLALKEVGAMIRLTRERIRQVEVSGIRKLQSKEYVREASDLGPPIKPR